MRRDYGTDRFGRRRCGVTTVIGETLGWSSESLRVWAARLAVDRALDAVELGLTPGDARAAALAAPDKHRDGAAALGTLVHALVETEIGGVPVVEAPGSMSDDDVVRAQACADRVGAWLKASGLHVLHSELAIVDEANEFGGTMDLVLSDGERAIIADIKTGKDVRRKPEIVIQLGGYAMLLRSRGIIADSGLVIHAPLDGEVAIVDVPSAALAAGSAAFACLLTVHHMRRTFEQTMRGKAP